MSSAGPEPANPSRVGQTLGAYRITGRIGAGGMGVVYKAEDLKLHRTVALKFFPPDLHAPDRARELFLQEARAASVLDHPNIGTIHTIEEADDGSSFIVMAYYEGETVGAKIRRGPLPPAQAIDIALQMAHGLAEAHRHNIVHRDIKPGNAIVTPQGRTKIVDFGLARVVQSSVSTASMAISGTAAYMSPEQAQGKLVDHRTDLWSLGVVLYEMLTARLPFPADNVPARLFAIVHTAPVPMSDEVPAELQAIVFRALAKDPEQRYRSAGEMAEELQRLQAPAISAASAATQTVAAGDLQQYLKNASQSALTAPPKRPARWKWVAALLAIPLVLALALLVPSVREFTLARLFGPAEKHIAVLPLTTIGNDPANTALADGLMESLTSKLSNLDVGAQSLWVVPASEVRRRKVNDAAAARREFGATLVVSGSVQRNGTTVRLIVNLIDARKTRQLGSAEFEDRTGDFSALQDSAIARLANLMRIPLTRDMLQTTGGSVKPAAYESYLKGLGLLQRYDKPGNLDQAAAALETAAGADPGFALAYASLGETFLLQYQTDQNPRWLERASAECRRAAELNDQLPPVHVTLGRILNAQGHVDLALAEFQRALELSPRSAEALTGVARAYEKQGRLQPAEQTFRRAIMLRPDYWDSYNNLGQFYFGQRRFSDAAAQFRKVIELTPDNANGYLNLGAALLNDGKLPEAAQALHNSLRIAPSYGAYTNLGNVYYRQRSYEEAARNYAQALALNDKDFRVWLNLAGAYRKLKREDQAKAASRRALPLLQEVAKTRPQDAVIQAALGLENARLGDREHAVAHLESAAALAPRDASVLERVGEGFESLGDRRQAIEWVYRALKNGYSMENLKQDPAMRGLVADPGFKPPVR